jgi:hypothetical protein
MVMVRPAAGPGLPADTAGGEEEPVHEDTRAVIVRIIGQQSVPFVLLLTDTVTTAPWGGGFAEEKKQ